MKKKLLATIMGLTLLFPVAAFAASSSGDSQTWYMNDSDTEIQGSLYLVGGDANRAQAKTENLSDNGIKVKVKIYATSGGTTISSSVKTNTGTTAYAKSTARKPDFWGSGHTTTPTSDPYEWLWISTED